MLDVCVYLWVCSFDFHIKRFFLTLFNICLAFIVTFDFLNIYDFIYSKRIKNYIKLVTIYKILGIQFTKSGKFSRSSLFTETYFVPQHKFEILINFQKSFKFNKDDTETSMNDCYKFLKYLTCKNIKKQAAMYACMYVILFCVENVCFIFLYSLILRKLSLSF